MALHTIVEHDSTHIKPYIDAVKTALTGEVVDSEPYVLRQGLGNLADMALVGGSVAWNQLVPNGNFASTSGWSVGSNTTFTASNNIGKVVPIDSSNSNQRFIRQIKAIPVNHKVLVMLELSGNNECTIGFYSSSWQDAAILTFNITNNKATYSQIASLSKDSATVGLYFSNSTEVNISNFMCIDLTALFGSSTIADYIYSLEQATAGAGVAWFRKYFSNLYYGYQPGKIESVNVASRKVIGKNIVIGIEGGTWSTQTQTKVSSNDRARVDSVLDVFPSTQYTISAKGLNNKTIQVIIAFYNNKGSGTFISESSWNTVPYTFTTPNNCKCLTVIFKTSNNDNAPQNYIAEPQIEIGSTATTYEPYKEYSFPFANIQLRGVPKLVDNKLSYDGDIYTADGTVTRKYGIVDLGTLNWFYESTTDHQRFRSTDAMSTAKGSTDNTSLGNIICSKYTTITASNTYQHTAIGIAISPDKYLYVYDSSAGTDASAFKTAMSGVYLVYELTTPTTESANAYQNPQRAFIDGTEEFIDYGVQSATRDVSIPVGNNTTYQLNETLPPTEDYVDGALKFKAAISALGTDESGRTTASRAYTTGEFFYKDGKMYKVLTSIASGATFTVGTNCQQTTLFAELKALAQ